MSPSRPKRVALSWSSGKDSAWSLYLLQQDPTVEVKALVTTLNEQFDRVAMHAVRRELLELQAVSAGLPLWTVPLPWPCSNEQYEARMRDLCTRAVAEGVDAMAFGDLFLTDIRAYRERQLAGTGLEPLFPVWQIPTDKRTGRRGTPRRGKRCRDVPLCARTEKLARDMIAAGLRAKITCVDPKALPREFAGRGFDLSFLADLPPTVDPCGENGEFHSFVYDGPMFQRPIQVQVTEKVERDGFVFSDLVVSRGASN